MSVAPSVTLRLDDRFARELPEMALAWKALPAPDPRLLVLNEPLAAELGLDADDPAWTRGAGAGPGQDYRPVVDGLVAALVEQRAALDVDDLALLLGGVLGRAEHPADRLVVAGGRADAVRARGGVVVGALEDAVDLGGLGGSGGRRGGTG